MNITCFQAKPNFVKKGTCSVDWRVRADLSIVHHDDDMDEFTDVNIHTYGQYCYYERVHVNCSERYCTTFRFGRDKVGDVLQHLANDPNGIEDYLSSLEGCRIISQERYST